MLVGITSCDNSEVREFSAGQNPSGLKYDKIVFQRDGDSTMISTIINNTSSREFQNIIVELYVYRSNQIQLISTQTLKSLLAGESVSFRKRVADSTSLYDYDSAILSFKIPFITASSPIIGVLEGEYGVVNTQTEYHPFGGEMKRKRTYTLEITRISDSTLNYSISYNYIFTGERSANNQFNNTGRTQSYEDGHSAYEEGTLQLQNISDSGLTFSMFTQNKKLKADRIFTKLPNYEGQPRDTVWLLEANEDKQIIFRKNKNNWAIDKQIETEKTSRLPQIKYEGKVYHIVRIGEQDWLKENLDVGTMAIADEGQSNDGVIEKYCYDNNPINCDKYGGLYKWDEAMQYSTTPGTQGICPPGWHLPTIDEFKTLLSNASAKDLIAVGEKGGLNSSSSQFSALFSGVGSYGHGRAGFWSNLETKTNYWSSTEQNNSHAYSLSLSGNTVDIKYSTGKSGSYYSIRCIKD